MSSLTHQDTCRCSLHAQLAARRHECYRSLAKAILGSAAPAQDAALAQTLADHAVALGVGHNNVTPIPPRRRAA
jgi:hypothetical protein